MVAALPTDRTDASPGTIEVRGLTKQFGRVQAVRDLDFTVHPGRVTGFLGPNGAGKTTTLRMLLSLVNPTAGTATIDGRNYRDLPEPARHVGAVLEATSFHPSRRARAHLKMITLASGIASSRIDEVLELVGLTADAGRKVGGYSLGMRQRLQLAGALLGDPGILILDEPSNGLDPQGIAWLRAFLRHFASEGRTVLVSSHLLAEMAQTIDDVVIVSQGRLRVQGPLSALMSRARPAMRVRTPEPDRLLSAAQGAGFAPRRVATDVVMVDNAAPEELGPVLAANQIVVYELVQEGMNLEALFLELTESMGFGQETVPPAPPAPATPTAPPAPPAPATPTTPATPTAPPAPPAPGASS